MEEEEALWHAENVEAAIYAVHPTIFDFLPILDDQPSCVAALSLLALHLISGEDLCHELARALKRRPNDSLTPEEEFSLVLHAASSNWPRALGALLAAPSFALECDAFFHQSVFVCAEKGHHECLEALIKSRPNVLVAKSDGTSALHIAAQNGHSLCCQCFVDLGTDINVRNNCLQTPLMYAVGSLETVSWFLSRADVRADLVDAEMMGAFQHASQERSAVAVAVMDLILRRWVLNSTDVRSHALTLSLALRASLVRQVGRRCTLAHKGIPYTYYIYLILHPSTLRGRTRCRRWRRRRPGASGRVRRPACPSS